MRNTTILFIEDDHDIQQDPLIIEIKELFQSVIFFDEPTKAIQYIKENHTNKIIIMLDLAFPAYQPNGHKILETIREFSFLIPIIIFSGRPEDSEPFADLINNKAFAFVKKDSSSEDVIKTLIEADEYLNSDVPSALEEWINIHSDEEKGKPFIKTSEGKTLTLNEILNEIRLETAMGKEFSKNLLKLTIDLLSRNKERFNG